MRNFFKKICSTLCFFIVLSSALFINSNLFYAEGNNVNSENEVTIIEKVDRGKFESEKEKYQSILSENMEEPILVEVSKEFLIENGISRFAKSEQYIRFARNKTVNGVRNITYGFYATVYSSGSFRNYIQVHFSFVEAPAVFPDISHNAYKANAYTVKGNYSMGGGLYGYSNWSDTWSLY